MQLASFPVRLTLIGIALMLRPASAMGPPPVKSIVVAVRCNADDGLSLRLKEAIEKAFKSSRDFSLSSGREPSAFTATIPTNVGWKQRGGRTRVSYTMEFSSVDNQSLGSIAGSCWDDGLAKCASQIVKKARIAAHKMH